MLRHRFSCGQHVTFSDKRYLGPSWSGAYVVVKHLPSGEGMPRYQIKSTGETYSRAAFENQLTTLLEIVR